MKVEQVKKCSDMIKEINEIWTYKMIPFYEKNNITFASLEVLNEVVEDELITLNSLAKRLKKSSANISATLKKMERCGFVQKGTSKSDKRVIYIKPTQAGSDLAIEGKLYFNKILDHVFKDENYVDELEVALEKYYLQLKKFREI